MKSEKSTSKKSTLDFSTMKKIEKNEREKKPLEKLKKSNSFQYNPESGTYRLYNDFSTTIEQIEKKENHRFTPYIEKDILYLHRENDGFTIKNTQHKNPQENYFQLPKGITKELDLIENDKKIEIEKIDTDTYKINLKQLTK